jgi:hypothetical protein
MSLIRITVFLNPLITCCGKNYYPFNGIACVAYRSLCIIKEKYWNIRLTKTRKLTSPS